jgi:hypothetical protein
MTAVSDDANPYAARINNAHNVNPDAQVVALAMMAVAWEIRQLRHTVRTLVDQVADGADTPPPWEDDDDIFA